MKPKLLLTIFFALIIAGCATTKSNTEELESRVLKRQVIGLEEELQDARQEINYLGERLKKAQEENAALVKAKEAKKVKKVKVASEARGLISDKIDVEPRDVQVALRNAGFYKGAIDGKLGKGTERAIIDFQKNNSLFVDGIIGKKTWERLKDNL